MDSANKVRIPTIQLWDVLLVPLQGEIGDEAASELAHDTLHRIQSTTVKGLIIDVTGLWMMDSHLCALLSRLASAASLMGVRSILCGMDANLALTLQTMGLELTETSTTLSLETALETLGIRTTRNDEAHDDDFLDDDVMLGVDGERPEEI